MTEDKTSRIVRDRVQRGAAWLDEHHPDWLDKVDVDRLRMSSTCKCVLGQVAEVPGPVDFSKLMKRMGIISVVDAIDCGFDIDGVFQAGCFDANIQHGDLQRAWTELINERRNNG